MKNAGPTVAMCISAFEKHPPSFLTSSIILGKREKKTTPAMWTQKEELRHLMCGTPHVETPQCSLIEGVECICGHRERLLNPLMAQAQPRPVRAAVHQRLHDIVFVEHAYPHLLPLLVVIWPGPATIPLILFLFPRWTEMPLNQTWPADRTGSAGRN